MNTTLKKDADRIIATALETVKPDTAVKQALAGRKFPGRVHLISVGKAGWQMAKAAAETLGDSLKDGIVITKYDHVMAQIPRVTAYEAGHPIPDDNTFAATEEAIRYAEALTGEDTVIFLLSGGGSALFEKPLLPAKELIDITDQLMACGADIVEINTIRKRLSAVKGGRFAQICAPAKVYAIILSDILGDPIDMIASGPLSPDHSTCEDALRVVSKYNLRLSSKAQELLTIETPKVIDNVEAQIIGSVRTLCEAAKSACESLGYRAMILTNELTCEAKEAGSFLGSIAKTYAGENASTDKLAFIAGGETIVRLTGHGKGGRNQELALSAALQLDGLKNAALFSIGSDGTDGPTDAAGGYVDGDTITALKKQDINAFDVLQQNDSYHALKASGGLIITGPTGTNVNDVAVVLIDR